MKIAILAYYFYPDQHIAAVRPENWATWLSEEHDVTVITRECTPELEKKFPFVVLRPRSYGIRFLEWAKHCRELLKSRHRKEKRQTTHKAILQKPQKSTGVFYSRMPSVHDLWFLACYSAIKKVSPDVVIATSGPYVSLLAAYFYVLNNPKTKLWIDYRDFWTQNHITVGIPAIKKIEEYLEKKCTDSASIISSIGKMYAEELHFNTKKRCHYIYNSPLKFNNYNELIALNKKINICYTGTIYPGWRDPSPLFNLIYNLAKNKFISPDKFLFTFASKFPGNLIELISAHNVSDFVKFCGEVSRQEAVNLQFSSSILLLLESSSPEAQGVLTGKVFEYLATDKPILLIGPGPDSELYQLLQKYDRLLTLEDFQDIVENARPLPVCAPVDFREISKKQLFAALKSI